MNLPNSSLSEASDLTSGYFNTSPVGGSKSDPTMSSPHNVYVSSTQLDKGSRTLLGPSERHWSEADTFREKHYQQRRKPFRLCSVFLNFCFDQWGQIRSMRPVFCIFGFICGAWMITQIVLFQFSKSVASSGELQRDLSEHRLRRYINITQSPISDFFEGQHSKPFTVSSQLVFPMEKSSMSFNSNVLSSTVFKRPAYSEDEEFLLTWYYGMESREWPYVGSDKYLPMLFPNESTLDSRNSTAVKKKKGHSTLTRLPRHYYNSLAVFPNQDENHLHGRLGVWPNGTLAYVSEPMPVKAEDVEGGDTAALQNGGFYLNLSNALPLDREAIDSRDVICRDIKYNLTSLDDVSIIITFYNEPFSTLMRSIHSVLNRTPPPLIREIILVDDHSNSSEYTSSSLLTSYLRVLPKVKLMRLPERRGIVTARLAGAKVATAPVIVILDSHIEINVGWLEPLLQRLQESPKSVVFPQIPSIDSKNFSYNKDSGIGCVVDFKWQMQEKAGVIKEYDSPDAILSPALAGGLWAMNKYWFWKFGGFDEEFSMWGAENVEMGFRIWLCGGRVECAPCSRVYHIYRTHGAGYSSPPDSLLKNRLRTARLWTDEYYQLAKYFIDVNPPEDLGSFDKMLALKEELQCKPFQWFLDNVVPERATVSIDSVLILGELRNKEYQQYCVDTLQHTEGGSVGVFPCHGEGETQSYIIYKTQGHIGLVQDAHTCISKDLEITSCSSKGKNDKWSVKDDQIIWEESQCLTMVQKAGIHQLALAQCDGADNHQKWKWTLFKRDENYKPLEFSEKFKKYKEKVQHRFDSPGIF